MLLTVAELIAQVPSVAAEDQGRLQTLLDAAENDINEILGPINPVSSNDASGTINELIRAHGDLLLLSRPTSQIIQIIEGHTTLDPSDYELKANGQLLRRLHASTSVHPSHRWHWMVDVTYVFDDLANRERVQMALVQLDLNHAPGSTQETIGSWSEQNGSQSGAWNYQTERQAILATLVPSAAAIF